MARMKLQNRIKYGMEIAIFIYEGRNDYGFRKQTYKYYKY